MAVAPSMQSAVVAGIQPSLAEVRELIGAYNLIPVSYSFIEDCETPVSAFLKLRALAPGEPAFLLESAEQGQRVGRWSFIGFRPRAVLRLPLSGSHALSRHRWRTHPRSPAARSASSAMT
jgi:anthranilate synthase component 1